MNLKCIHGYFIITETRIGQVSDFMARFGFSLVRKHDYYTFETIADAPEYSIQLKPYLNLPATKTFEGKPWEVFEENGFVYNFSLDILQPIISVTQLTTVNQAGSKFLSPGLILPGSVTADGKRVKDYSAWYSRDNMTFKYSEVEYV